MFLADSVADEVAFGLGWRELLQYVEESIPPRNSTKTAVDFMNI